MTPNDKNEQLLAEILETQRAHFEEYKRVTSESLELQRKAVETQSRHIRLYRRFIVVATIIIVGLIGYLTWLSGKLP
jgi:hypothetical protein